MFVAFVHKDSPAAMAGLRFGDQILQVDGDTVAGWDTDKAHKVLKNCPSNGIKLAIRDRLEAHSFKNMLMRDFIPYSLWYNVQ